MADLSNPALAAFVAQLGDEGLLAQVLIRRHGGGYELRHQADHAADAAALRLLAPADARELAQFTATGAFRPLKSAPNLRAGWRLVALTNADLERALDQLYPGAIADWFAAQAEPAPVTDYRAFTDRQSGMYRVAQMLTDEQAAHTIRAACHARFCLKRRRWTVAGLEPDTETAKSRMPCLEPCALLLELARGSLRIEQSEKIPLALAPAEAATLFAALQSALTQPDPAVREGDLGNAANPRRIQLVLEKFHAALQPLPAAGS